MFEEVLGLKTILLGFGLDSDVIHYKTSTLAYLIFIRELKQYLTSMSFTAS